MSQQKESAFNIMLSSILAEEAQGISLLNRQWSLNTFQEINPKTNFSLQLVNQSIQKKQQRARDTKDWRPAKYRNQVAVQ